MRLPGAVEESQEHHTWIRQYTTRPQGSSIARIPTRPWLRAGTTAASGGTRLDGQKTPVAVEDVPKFDRFNPGWNLVEGIRAVRDDFAGRPRCQSRIPAAVSAHEPRPSSWKSRLSRKFWPAVDEYVSGLKITAQRFPSCPRVSLSRSSSLCTPTQNQRGRRPAGGPDAGSGV